VEVDRRNPKIFSGERRLVRHAVAAEDERSYRVALTPAGRRLYAASNHEFRERIGQVARRYTAAELTPVRSFLADFAAIVAEWRQIPHNAARARANG